MNELQSVLDNCENYSDAAMPDCFCSDWLTYKGHGKEEGVQYPDEDIVEGLQEIQPDPIDTQVYVLKTILPTGHLVSVSALKLEHLFMR